MATQLKIEEDIHDLKTLMFQFQAKLEQKKRYESDDLAKLFDALAKAQQEMDVARTDCSNPFFKSKYADLASVVKASRPYLTKHGLSVMQRMAYNDAGVSILLTRLCHSSGQWLESVMSINPPKQDIQTIGSYITYLRRYTYASIVGVVVSEEDDDGETAMQQPRLTGEAPKVGVECITKAQLQVISQELEGHEELLENLLKGYKVSKLSDIPARNYTQCINRIREIKRAKEA